VARIARGTLIIREYSNDLASDFYEINAEWITSMFCLEQTDREVLENPKERIIAPGGTILFVEAPNLGVVGACALQKTGATSFELTKMGVRASARGLKAGEFLLSAVIDRARTRGAKTHRVDETHVDQLAGGAGDARLAGANHLSELANRHGAAVKLP
jgi:GNAT superfamily N-acetyltransferase